MNGRWATVDSVAVGPEAQQNRGGEKISPDICDCVKSKHAENKWGWTAVESVPVGPAAQFGWGWGKVNYLQFDII